MPNSSRGSGSKNKKKLLKKGLAVELAEDPTSIFFSALRHSHPEALAALANYCQRRARATEVEVDQKVEHDRDSVLSAMEKLKSDGTQSSSKLKAITKEEVLANTPLAARDSTDSELASSIVVPESERLAAEEPDEKPDIDRSIASEPELELEPVAEPEPEPEPEQEPEPEPEPEPEKKAKLETEIASEEESSSAKEEDSPSQEELTSEQDAAPTKKAAVVKEPMRISPPKNPSAPTKKGIAKISGDAIESIPGAFDKGIQEEFKGAYEKAIQRGGVFDAKHRDAFSSESEKKVRSSYIGLKAISFDEALTAQSEKDPTLMRSQSQNVEAPAPPEASEDTAKLFLTMAGKVFSTPVIIGSAIVFFSFMGFFVFNLYRAEGFLHEGEAAFEAKMYPQAINSLTVAANMNPMRARAFFFRGRANNKIGEPGKAIADFTSSLKINPNNEEVLDHRATNYIRAGKFESALADYQKIFQLNPDDRNVYRYNNAAQAARQCGKFEQASAFYDKALAIAPGDTNAMIGKALCEADSGRHGKAIELCEKMIEKNPQLEEAYVHRGWCYMLLKRDDMALKDFNFALSLNPRDARALLNRGLLHYKLGNLASAVKDYSAAVAADPKLIDARAARGWAVMNTNPALALEDFKIVASSSQFGTSVKFWKERADLEAKLGDNNQAARTYARAIKLVSTSEPATLCELYVKLSKVLLSLRRYEEAIENCEQALKLDPRNAQALTLRGRAHDGLNNGISAIADYSAALAINPKLPDALWHRAQHYMKTREYHSAQKDFADYLAAMPDDKNAKKYLALVNSKTAHSASGGISSRGQSKRYSSVPFEQLVSRGLSELNSGKTEVAAEMLTEAVRKNPSDSTARRYLCHALVREDPKAAVVQFDVLRSAITLPPDDERSYRHALSLAATGSLVESAAIDKALKVVSEDPYNGQACYKLSTLYAAAGMLSKAAQYCQSGLSGAKDASETKRFQDLYKRLNKQHIEGEHKEDIEG